jgi:hypothetical protein
MPAQSSPESEEAPIRLLESDIETGEKADPSEMIERESHGEAEEGKGKKEVGGCLG